MPLSSYKIRELETFAHKLNTEPDKLLDALISFVFLKSESIKLLSPEKKVKAIEEEALNKGWTLGQLWNIYKHQRQDLMGLIYYLDDNKEIIEVTEKYIAIKYLNSGAVNKISNMNVEQEWITKIE